MSKAVLLRRGREHLQGPEGSRPVGEAGSGIGARAAKAIADSCGKSLAVRRPVRGGGGRVQLCALFEARHRRSPCCATRKKTPARPVCEFRFRHPAHKTGNVWHCRIPTSELGGATLYALSVEGPHDPERGHRFDSAESPARSLRAVGVLSAGVQPRGVRQCRPHRRACAARPSAGHAEPGHSGRGGPATQLPRHHRLRAARQGLHRARELRGRTREARHVCRR